MPHQTEGCSRGGCPIRQREAVGEGAPSDRGKQSDRGGGCPIRQREAVGEDAPSDRGKQ